MPVTGGMLRDIYSCILSVSGPRDERAGTIHDEARAFAIHRRSPGISRAWPSTSTVDAGRITEHHAQRARVLRRSARCRRSRCRRTGARRANRRPRPSCRSRVRACRRVARAGASVLRACDGRRRRRRDDGGRGDAGVAARCAGADACDGCASRCRDRRVSRPRLRSVAASAARVVARRAASPASIHQMASASTAALRRARPAASRAGADRRGAPGAAPA